MSHQLSFEAAAALKAANFPQPAPAPGQYWYNKSRDLLWIQFSVNRGAIGHFFEIGGFEAIDAKDFASLTYCPTAEDILRELGDNWYLSHLDGEWFCQRLMGADIEKSYRRTSAAEACAAAWLDKNKNKI